MTDTTIYTLVGQVTCEQSFFEVYTYMYTLRTQECIIYSCQKELLLKTRELLLKTRELLLKNTELLPEQRNIVTEYRITAYAVYMYLEIVKY